MIMSSKSFNKKYPAVCLPHLKKLLCICASPFCLPEIGVWLLHEMGLWFTNYSGTKSKSKLLVFVFVVWDDKWKIVTENSNYASDTEDIASTVEAAEYFKLLH